LKSYPAARRSEEGLRDFESAFLWQIVARPRRLQMLARTSRQLAAAPRALPAGGAVNGCLRIPSMVACAATSSRRLADLLATSQYIRPVALDVHS